MITKIRFSLIFLGICLLSSCQESKTNLQTEISKWEAKGWQFEEIVGNSHPDSIYLLHMSSDTAQSTTAFSTTNDGNQESKEFIQKTKKYLVVSMGHEAHGNFCLVFSKAKNP